MGGDSTGTQAPAERSGWLFWARQAGRPVGGKKRAGSSTGLLMVAIFVSPN